MSESLIRIPAWEERENNLPAWAREKMGALRDAATRADWAARCAQSSFGRNFTDSEAHKAEHAGVVLDNFPVHESNTLLDAGQRVRFMLGRGKWIDVSLDEYNGSKLAGKTVYLQVRGSWSLSVRPDASNTVTIEVAR